MLEGQMEKFKKKQQKNVLDFEASRNNFSDEQIKNAEGKGRRS